MVPRFQPDGDIVRRGIPDDLKRHVDRRSFLKGAGATLAAGSMAGCAALSQRGQQAGGGGGGGEIPDEPLELGVVAFTSGPAAIFGVPAANAARMIVEGINDQGGILGQRQINLEVIDESGEEPVKEFRRLATQANKDIIIGYISSGNMLSVAPVAEELEQLTIIFDAGSNALFDEKVDDPKWVFRTSAHLSVGAVGAAQLVANALPDVETIAGVNQDYAWGRDNMDMFKRAVTRLADIEVVEEQWPPLFNEDFNPHVSALIDAEPDFIYSSLWGGDLSTFISQGGGQGLFDQSLVCFNAGTHAFGDLGEKVPEGHLWGARGPHFPLGVAQDNPKHVQFVNSFVDRFDKPPFSHGAYHMWQAIHAYVGAIEKAYALSGEYPDDEALIDAMEGIAFHSPSGFVQLANANGHQAVESGLFGFSTHDNDYEWASLRNPVWIAPENANPPPEKTTAEWIDSL